MTKITLSAMVVDPPSPSYGATRRVPVFGVRGRTNSNDESGFAGFLLRQGYGGQVFFDRKFGRGRKTRVEGQKPGEVGLKSEPDGRIRVCSLK